MIDPLAYTETHWERIAQTRWGRYMSEVEMASIMEAHKMMETPTTALEVGCEGGRWSSMLADLGWKMTCTDINPKALEICRGRIPNADVRLVGTDDKTLPCGSGTIDLLLCIEGDIVMQQDWILQEAIRVLRPGGLMVSVIWNKFSWRGLLGHLVGTRIKKIDYYRFSYPQWRRRFDKAGFEMLRQTGFCWFPFGRSSDSILVPVCTKLERLLGLGNILTLSPWISLIAKKGNI